MPITQNEAKRRLAKLSSEGGGIISGAKKSEIDGQSNVLVIGLGGLGCKTVNEIAGVYKRDFLDQGKLSYIAIDTDKRCFDRISSLNGGNIDNSDMFPIYNDDVQNLLKNPRNPYIRSFVSDDVPPDHITNQGAQQRRIVGKVMLCGGQAYGELRTELKRRIDLMGGGSNGEGMQIIIVAGISGGTGSGTFIDVSYMVQEIAKENGNNSVFGVFYTPDVQRNEPWCNDTIWKILQKNGYSSMKELDYFMSVGKGEKVVYSLPLSSPIMIDSESVSKIESKLPIFKREYVFIVSETDTNKTEEDIVGATAISLLNLFRKSTNLDGDRTQNILSNLCNITSYIDTWGNDNIGASNDPNRPNADPAKIKYTNHPVSMHYSYASFDYKSVYVPRNEMAAYCTNLILKDLLHDKFIKALQSVSNSDVLDLARVCALDSLDSIYSVADTLSGWHNLSLRIQSNSAAYPQPGLMRVKCDASAAVDEAKRIADNSLASISADMNKIWDAFENVLNEQLLNNAKLWNMIGPYGVIVFMSGNNDGVTGLIQHIRSLNNDYANKLQALQTARDNAESAMQNYQKALAEDLRVTDAEILRMVDLCENYSKAYYDHRLYEEAMPHILNAIEVKLSELNNRTFETYVPVMQAIEDIVNEDAERFMHSTLQQEGYGTVYRVDAFNIDNALASSKIFEGFFKGYLNNQQVIQAEQNLFSTLFNAQNRDYWEALTTTEDRELAESNAVQKVREVFKTITDPLIGSMLEKFMVMIYCDPQIFRNAILQPGEDRMITLDDLNDFWQNNPQNCDAALRIAAEKILAELNSGGMIKYGVEPDVSKPFDSIVEIVSIPDLPNLNNILRDLVALMPHGSFSVAEPDVAGNRPKTEISLFKNSGPFPLTFVNRMRQYAVNYFASERSAATAAGRHGDEVTDCWQKNMPELYGLDADMYFESTRHIAPISDAEHPRGNHDRMVFEEVRNLTKVALEGGYLYLPLNENRYKMVVLKKGMYEGNPQLTVDEVIVKIINKLQIMLSEHNLLQEERKSLPTWVDAAKALGAEEQHNEYYYIEEHYLDTNLYVINSNFCEVQAEKPELSYEISNLERLVRMDMTILNELRDEAFFYQDKNFFGEIERIMIAIRREQALQDLIGYYLAAYKLGWITIEKGYLICKPDRGESEVLLDCRTGFGSGQDNQLLQFLMISAFCAKIEHNESMKKRIQSAYKDYQLTDDQLSKKQLAIKGNMPDWKKDILEPLHDTMESDSFKDYDMTPIYDEVFRKFRQSKYQDAYGYPIAVTCGKDIFDNINKVLNTLNYYDEVGDNRLVPDAD